MADTQQQQQQDVKVPSKEELLDPTIKQEATEGGESTKETHEEPQYTEVEKAAIAQGWKPLDEWDGDPSQHRSAREYLDRGELIGKIKTQNQQLSELRKGLQQLAEHNQRVYVAGYEQAVKELKAQRAMALKEGDADTVLAIEDKLDEAKEKLAEAKDQAKVKVAPPPGPSVVTQNWLQVNTWYKDDQAMRYAANSYAQQLAAKDPTVTEEEVYAHIDRQIRKDFPHKFQKAGGHAPSPDGDSRRSAGGGKASQGTTTFDKVLSTMTEEQQSIAKNLIKTGVISKEKYVEDWNRINGGR